jgi:hypothetical protein
MYDQSSPPPPPGTAPAGGASRYPYLVGRLRSRQITMEEATELFNLMQGMLTRVEAARAALAAAATAQGASPRTTAPTSTATPTGTRVAVSDDAVLLGLIALGAGAGLVTALAKRVQDNAKGGAGAPPATSGARP